MYAVSPAAEAEWKALIGHVAADAGASFDYLAYPAPQPLEALWRRPDLGCVQMCGYPIALGIAEVLPLASPVPAAPWAGGKAVYRSDLIVRKDAPYRALADTFGGAVGWTVEHSHSGFNALRHHLLPRRGEGRARLYRDSVGHLVTARGVLDSVRDGGIDIGPLDAYWHMLLRKYRPALTEGVRILAIDRDRADARLRRRAGPAGGNGRPPARLLCGGAYAALVRAVPGGSADREVRDRHAGDVRPRPWNGTGRPRQRVILCQLNSKERPQSNGYGIADPYRRTRMHELLTTILDRLHAAIQTLESTIPSDDPFGNAHNNWSFPGTSKLELIEEVQSIIQYIEENDIDDLGDCEPRIIDYIRRLDHLNSQTIPNIWGNSGLAVPAFQITIHGLKKALSSTIPTDISVDNVTRMRKVRRQLRGMEAGINELEPRTESLVAMVERIEQAHNAADQLPTDMETLSEARDKVSELLQGAESDQRRVVTIRESADEIDKVLADNLEQAKAVLARCETAYSAATSVGLAAAFSERSRTLSNSMWFWVAGLISALALGGFLGSDQLHTLSKLFLVPETSGSVIVLNILLSMLSVGAPVWFAWLATKQIGQRFRLSEDYAFKASISRAYEGFRREAARFDKDMEAKLLVSALARLDELPLRLVEEHSHGSPWHELASSDVVKKAMKDVPGFAGQVRDLARRVVGAGGTSRGGGRELMDE